MKKSSAALEMAAAAAVQCGFAYVLAAVVSRAEARETRELRRPRALHLH
jgi:hypothetical protein